MKNQVQVLAVTLTMLAAPLTAHAQQSGATAAVGSDYLPETLELPRPRLEHGSIATKNAKAEVGAGYLWNSNGQNGVSVSVDVNKKYLVEDKPKSDGSSYSIVAFNPGLSLDVSVNNKTMQPIAINGEASLLTIGQGQTFMTYMRDEDKKLAEEIQSKLVGLSYKESILRYKGGFHVDLEKERDALAKEREALLKEAAQNRFGVLNDHVGARNRGIQGSAEFRIMNVGAVYRDIRNLNIIQHGANMSFLEGSAHGAIRINGWQVDLCGSIAPIIGVIGASEGIGAGRGTAALCAGVQLGKLGHLTHEVRGTTDWNSYGKISNTTALKEVFGTPLVLHHVREVESDESISVETNTVGAKVSF